MNQKEVSELRCRFRSDKSAVSRIYGCYVNSSREIVSYLDESLGSMPQDEAEKYLSLLKKSLSGTLGRNLIDLVFSTQQVADSEEHRLLMSLRDSKLKDREVRETFYRKVIDSLELEESGYLILLVHDDYDVPRRAKDNTVMRDASDEVFSYLLCCVCPIKERKAELGFFPGDNEFHTCGGQVVSAPELGFLFPAFDGRAANLYNALFYTRKAGEIHQEVIDAVFHVEPPMSAAEQREAFQAALSDALDEAYQVEIAQTVYERLNERIHAHKENKDPEAPIITPGEIGGILRECGVAEEQVAAFQEQCAQQFGPGATLNPANLIDAGRFEVKTADATISVPPERSYLVETRSIDGRRYLLVPAEEAVEINGAPVRVPRN